MMVAGLAIGLLEAAVLTIAVVCGIVASLFFEINFSSLAPRMEILKEISFWSIAICGSIGGIIWSYYVIKEHWEQFKIHGRGW
jgi:membrane associated rhomboid family serine protease